MVRTCVAANVFSPTLTRSAARSAVPEPVACGSGVPEAATAESAVPKAAGVTLLPQLRGASRAGSFLDSVHLHIVIHCTSDLKVHLEDSDLKVHLFFEVHRPVETSMVRRWSSSSPRAGGFQI